MISRILTLALHTQFPYTKEKLIKKIVKTSMAPCLPKVAGNREGFACCGDSWLPRAQGGCSAQGNEFRKGTCDTWITYRVAVKSHENEMRDLILPQEPHALLSHKTLAKALECCTDKSKEKLPASVGRNIRTWPVIRLMIYTEIFTEDDKNEGLWSCTFLHSLF